MYAESPSIICKGVFSFWPPTRSSQIHYTLWGDTHPCFPKLCFVLIFSHSRNNVKVRPLPSVCSLAVVVEVGCKPREIFSVVTGATDPDSVSPSLTSIFDFSCSTVKLTLEQQMRAASFQDQVVYWDVMPQYFNIGTEQWAACPLYYGFHFMSWVSPQKRRIGQFLKM